MDEGHEAVQRYIEDYDRRIEEGGGKDKDNLEMEVKSLPKVNDDYDMITGQELTP